MNIEIPDSMIEPVLKLLDAGVRAGGLSVVEATYTVVKAMENANRIEAERQAKMNAEALAKSERDAQDGGKASVAAEDAIRTKIGEAASEEKAPE